ncbi:MAG: 30S ribosomal protein S14 [Chloroflexi bacterium]|nr:30S ribosomal protein S14 [Chloroflexota bacterium]|tara:strand:+ start:2257 stop:2562 length:306 start_codon:yes stop_codon:yes gene_type:complete
MARKAKIVREQKIEKMIEKYSVLRKELLSIWNDSSLSLEKRREARVALARLPKNSNPNRHRNRCSLTGRSRGYVGFVGLSRIKFREKALQGEFPGIRKASF